MSDDRARDYEEMQADLEAEAALKEGVWDAWLKDVKATKGVDSVRDMVKVYGFTGPFVGLEYMGLDTLIERLETLLGVD